MTSATGNSSMIIPRGLLFSNWYSIDRRCLVTAKPAASGIYIAVN